MRVFMVNQSVFTVNQSPLTSTNIQKIISKMQDKISFKDDPVAYRQAIAKAIEWKEGEGSTEHLVTAVCIFRVDEDAIRKALKHKEEKNRNNRGFFNTHGGNNRILTESQEEAIFSYCFDQWEMGLGATKRMVFSAITFIRTHEEPPKEAPSWRWFTLWLNKHPTLHTIKTKPIAHELVESHTEDEVKRWFEDYRQDTCKYGIHKPKNILNMDETGARVACPKGEE